MAARSKILIQSSTGEVLYGTFWEPVLRVEECSKSMADYCVVVNSEIKQGTTRYPIDAEEAEDVKDALQEAKQEAAQEAR